MVIRDVDLDDYMGSITKSNFLFTVHRTFSCHNCGYVTDSVLPLYNMDVCPGYYNNITDLLEQSLYDVVTKRCDICLCDTRHYEKLKLVEFPKYFIILIKRFEYSAVTQKKHDLITIERKINFQSKPFTHIASAFHHGETATSRHYTAKVLYDEVTFLCNDNFVSHIDSDIDEVSREVYFIIYKLNDEQV